MYYVAIALSMPSILASWLHLNTVYLKNTHWNLTIAREKKIERAFYLIKFF